MIEKCNHLLLEVENSGYVVNQFDLLDGSVGSHWKKYREAIGLKNPIKEATYLIPSRCRFPFKINAFPNDELGTFSGWLETIYEQSHLAPYLKRTYGALAKRG